jgi:hypothetical protein
MRRHSAVVPNRFRLVLDLDVHRKPFLLHPAREGAGFEGLVADFEGGGLGGGVGCFDTV